LTAGKTYYLITRYYSSSQTGHFTVYATGGGFSVPGTGTTPTGTTQTQAPAASTQPTATAQPTANMTQQTPEYKVSLNASSIPLKKKQKTTAVKVTSMTAGDSVVSWKSSNTKIVKVKGKSNGTATITAQNKTGKAKITVTFKSGLTKTINVKVQAKTVTTKSIKGLKKSISLKKGKSTTLKPELNPITSSQKITYKSSNPKVATVSSKGVVKGKKKGTAKITVKSGSKKFVVTVKVK
jgi:hypothetical protein